MLNNIIQFFAYEHLPPDLQEVSKPFCELARRIDCSFAKNAETTTCLRKLLEAKDCAVRSVIYKEVP